MLPPDDSSGRSTQSWWTTVPGFLTAMSGVVTALTGLLVALHAMGYLQPKPQPEKAAAESKRVAPAPITTTTTTLAPAATATTATRVECVEAVINDPDHFTNVRFGPGVQYRVVAKINEGEVFCVQSKSGQWWAVSTSNGTVGYVYYDRVRLRATAIR